MRESISRRYYMEKCDYFLGVVYNDNAVGILFPDNNVIVLPPNNSQLLESLIKIVDAYAATCGLEFEHELFDVSEQAEEGR